MTKPLTEPSTLLANITHREMLDAMADSGIFCSVDKFRRVLDWAQRRALAEKARRDLALDKMVANQTELGLYDDDLGQFLTREKDSA